MNKVNIKYVTIKTIKYYHADVQKTRSGIYKVESATRFSFSEISFCISFLTRVLSKT
jgi:hypothetical protein